MSPPQLLATDPVIGESARGTMAASGCRTGAPKRFSRMTWKAPRGDDAGAYNHPVPHRLAARRTATGGGRHGAAGANDRMIIHDLFLRFC